MEKKRYVRTVNGKQEFYPGWLVIDGMRYASRNPKPEWLKAAGYTEYVPEEPAPYEPSEGEKAAAEIAELKQELAGGDYKIIKCEEAALVGGELPYDIASLKAERDAIRARINALEAAIEAEKAAKEGAQDE